MEIKRYIFDNKEAWKDFRKDLFTGSRISCIMPDGKRLMTAEELVQFKKDNPKSKAKYIEDASVIGDGAISYILELIQNVESEPKAEFYNAAMEWGTVTEPEAVFTFCDLYGYDLNSDDVIYTSISEVVFFVADGTLGATPDLITPKEIAQIKCPNSDTHLYYKLFVNEANFAEELPDYSDQVQTEMMLCERPHCKFFSFDPRFKKKELQHHTIEVPRNVKRQNEIYAKTKICSAKKLEFLNKLNGISEAD